MSEPAPLRLLLIEDSPDDEILLVHALREAGYAVEHRRVETAEQLRDNLNERPWDAVISDYRLPAFDGLRALEMVRQHDPDLPFVFVSGTAHDAVGIRAMQDGANDYIMKGNLSRLGPAMARELKEARRRRQTQATQVQYRAILDGTQDAILVVDARGWIQIFNQGAEMIFGYAPREVLGQPVGLLLPGDSFTLLKSKVARLRQPPALGPGAVFEGRYLVIEGRRRDGGSVQLEASSSRVLIDGQYRFTLVLRDISERLRAERALRESQERLRTLLQAIPDLVWLKDPEGRFLHCNRRMEELLGVTEADILGRTDDDFVDHETASRFRLNDLTAMTAGAPCVNEEELTFASDGHREIVQTIKTPVYDEHGEIVGVLGIARDVTEAKRTEQELQHHRHHLQELVNERTAELRAAREQALALANSKSEFLANMSHEIRTPMNAVLGLAYLLEKQDLPDEARALAHKIHQSGRSLLGIINDILDFSRLESGRIQVEHTAFRLTQVLDNLATIMSATAEDKSIDLLLVPPPCSDWTLRGDPLRLGQVLINLTSNAIKFTESGLVEVRIEPVERSPLEVRMRFSVRDTGIGIDAQTQTQLFRPFSQADVSTTRRYGGSGLGLAISRRLVELMGGRMGLESTPGVGSTFWFELPFEIADRLPREGERQPLQMQTLVVASNPVPRDGLTATVRALGWSARQAGSARQALDLVLGDASLQGPDALLLLDWRLPEEDGLATARLVREALPLGRRPLLFVVTADYADILREARDNREIDGMLAKPLAPSPLYDAVVRARNQLGEAEGVATPPQPRRRLAGMRMLIVDDSEINREVARQIFLDEGAEVSLASDGREAVDWLLAHPEAVDIVLMDVQMPVMDGHEATRLIRQHAAIAWLPVAALTAGAMHTQELSARAAGMNAFISKPFDVEEAIAVITNLIGASKGRTERAGVTPTASGDPPADACGSPTDPDLPGLAVTRGLTIWKDPELYRRHLRSLARELAGLDERIAAAAPDAARQSVHRLKGAAGNLGLLELAARAGELEQRLASATGAESLAAARTALRSALAQALDSIGRYAPESPATVSPQTHSPPDSPDRARIAPLLQRALAALRDFDPIGAEPILAELATALPAERLAHLRQTVEDLDAIGGVAALLALADELAIDLEDQTCRPDPS